MREKPLQVVWKPFAHWSFFVSLWGENLCLFEMTQNNRILCALAVVLPSLCNQINMTKVFLHPHRYLLKSHCVPSTVAMYCGPVYFLYWHGFKVLHASHMLTALDSSNANDAQRRMTWPHSLSNMAWWVPDLGLSTTGSLQVWGGRKESWCQMGKSLTAGTERKEWRQQGENGVFWVKTGRDHRSTLGTEEQRYTLGRGDN